MSRHSNLVELQKTMDKLAFDLESKYNKHLGLEELKDGFVAEVCWRRVRCGGVVGRG